MKLNETLVEIAKEKLTKEDKIKLHELTGLKQSAVYNACRGERNLREKDYDIFQKYIIGKTELSHD